MRPLLIRDGIVVLAAGPRRADVLCVESRIVAIGQDLEAPDAIVLDAAGLTVGPGFVDIHTHGGHGNSFFAGDPEQVYGYSKWAPQVGVTAFLVSTGTTDMIDVDTALSRLAPSVMGPPEGAEPLGFHVEGPFLNPKRRGAFYAEALEPPSIESFVRMHDAAFGLIRLVTLAPELPGALDVVRAVTGSGATAAIGHTDATGPEAEQGFAAGITHVTHLFNAMRPIHQRHGGPTIAAMLDESITCELIFDGAHISTDVLRAAYRILGPARTCVVTDNVSLAGLGQQSVNEGNQRLTVKNGAAVRPDGTIMGSVTTMDQNFRNVIQELRVDLPTAFRMCATNPARVAGSARRKGLLDRGADADLVLLNNRLDVVATVCRGELAWDSRP